MKPMAKGDILHYVTVELANMIASRGLITDHVSYVDAHAIASLLQAESELEPIIDHQEVDPDKALATLFVALGTWYAGGSMQDAVSASATLAEILGKVTA
jgi:hypothetical protein